MTSNMENNIKNTSNKKIVLGLEPKKEVRYWKNRDPAKESQKIKRYNDSKKNIVFLHYGAKCACCGETIPQFLSVDHINNDGCKDLAKSGLRRGGLSLYIDIIKNNFPDTFQILCMNCNWGKHLNHGRCPHETFNS